MRGPGLRHVTIEDCRVEQFDDNVLLDGGSDVSLRRCVLLDVRSGGAGGTPAHGVAAYGCGGTIRIESCVFDQNVLTGGPSHHHVFAPHGSEHIVVTGCVIARGPGTALLLDAAQNAVTGNIFIGNRLHVAVGGSEATVSGNLILGGRDRQHADESAHHAGSPPHAIWATTSENLRIERNVIAHRSRARGPAIALARARGAGEASPAPQTRAAHIIDNVLYACGGGIEIGRDARWRVVKLLRNDIQRVPAARVVISMRDGESKLSIDGNRYGMFDPTAMRFRLGDERLTPADWAARTGDTSLVLRREGTAHAARLPRRFIADARAQSGIGWRALLAPAAIIERFLRAFELSSKSEIRP